VRADDPLSMLMPWNRRGDEPRNEASGVVGSRIRFRVAFPRHFSSSTTPRCRTASVRAAPPVPGGEFWKNTPSFIKTLAKPRTAQICPVLSLLSWTAVLEVQEGVSGGTSHLDWIRARSRRQTVSCGAKPSFAARPCLDPADVCP
jgi:hypothetical protein